MNIFQSKSKYTLGMTKEPYEPIDLHTLYESAKKKKKDEDTRDHKRK